MINVQVPFLVIIGLFTFYLSLLTALAFFYSSVINEAVRKWNRFAVIIPAHNEEIPIEQTLQYLFNISYPYELFDVIVVADNCEDKTAVISARKGALVLERFNKNFKGKGYALKWSFDLLLRSSKKYDAFLIVDADTMVSENILQIMNSYINNGAEAIQCSDLVRPQQNSWSSEITRVGLILYNYVKPLGKKVINCSSGLRGNGMCFTSDILKRNPWQAFSQTEDLEYGINLLLNGTRTIFAPEAQVKAIMPTNSKNAESQRARWEIGRFPLIFKYAGNLFLAAISKKSLDLFDTFLDLISPAFVNLFSLTILMIMVNIVLLILNISGTNIFMLIWSILLFMQIYHVIGGLYVAGADLDAYKALFHVPRYAVWKMLLYLKLALKGHAKLWVRTAREVDSDTVFNKVAK